VYPLVSTTASTIRALVRAPGFGIEASFHSETSIPGDGLTSPQSCRIGINGHPKAVIGVLGWPAGWDKVLRKIFKDHSILNNQTVFRLGELIHNSDRIKMSRFADLKKLIMS
jgi:hypothetical protein